MNCKKIIAGLISFLCIVGISGCGNTEESSVTMETILTETNATEKETVEATSLTTEHKETKNVGEVMTAEEKIEKETTVVTEEATTEIITEQVITENINTDFTEAIENEYNRDLSLITADGHPTYYGSIEDAHNVWDNTEEGKVIFANSFSNYSNRTIINISDSQNENSEIIKYIEIYFKNFSNPMNIYLDTALNIASEYIPHDIIDKWYEFNESYCIKPLDMEDKNTYYIVSYRLTDKGKEARNSNEHTYGATIYIILYANSDDTVDCLTIGFDIPRWMKFLDTNACETVEWNYDLCKNN